MKILKNKITATAIAIFLMFSMTASMTLIPSVIAHTPPWNIPTVTYVSCNPTPVGLGQTLFIIVWSDFLPPTAQGAQGDRWTFYINVTDPDKVKSTLGPFTSDDTGSAPTRYIVTKIGNYTFQGYFPAQTLAGKNPPLYPQGIPYVGDNFESSISQPSVVTVQSSPISAYPNTPTPSPNSYWQAPIEANNINWATLGGAWFTDRYNMTSLAFNPYTTAPSSGHILWTKSFEMGGQIGGATGNETTPMGGADQYATAFSPVIIMDGVLIYNEYTAGVGLPGVIGVNLRTGATVWTSNGSGVPVITGLSLSGQPGALYDNYTFNRITYGEIWEYVSPDQYGGNAFLWAINGVTKTGAANPRYDLYDASTGAYMLSLTHSMACTLFTFDPAGAICGYVFSATGKWLAMWNSSLVVGMTSGTYGNPGWSLRPQVGMPLDWRTGVQWNVSIPVYTQPFTETLSKVVGGTSGVILASTMSTYGSAPQTSVMDIGYSAITGQQLFANNITFTGPVTLYSSVWTGAPAGNGIYTHFDKNNLKLNAYNLWTGKQIWTCNAFASDPLAYYDDVWSMGYGCVYVGSYGGYIYCVNDTNGNLIWKQSTGADGYEFPGGANWPVDVWSGAGVGFALADGKLYVSTGHAYNPPMFNGAQMYCLNASTGSPIYSIRGLWENLGVADGVMTVFNGYDNAIYAFGKGLSATTVNAAPGINSNSQVLISGSVTDQSPGQTCLGIPAAGTPAISDASQSAWMAYLYEQQPEPMNATGVPVALSYIDPNNNTYIIGKTTSNINGQYSYTFKPDIPGKYTIIATFGGSNSYFSSTAQTPMLWNPPTSTAAPTATPTSVADTYFMPAIISLVVIIIIGFAILAIIVLRKRP